MNAKKVKNRKPSFLNAKAENNPSKKMTKTAKPKTKKTPHF